MPPARKSGGSDSAARAMQALERGAVTLGIQVARSLHGRWREMSSSRRAPLAPLAEDVKDRALDLRGEADRNAAGRELHHANERLADAIVKSAAADPDVTEIEVRDLRAELAQELERLAEGNVQASRGPGNVAGETASTDGQA